MYRTSLHISASQDSAWVPVATTNEIVGFASRWLIQMARIRLFLQDKAHRCKDTQCHRILSSQLTSLTSHLHGGLSTATPLRLLVIQSVTPASEE